MKIQITSRSVWRHRVRDKIKKIEDRRALEDANYEREWSEKYHRRPGWLRWFIGPTTEKPPEGFKELCFYPSIYAWGDLYRYQSLEKALADPATGDIYLSDDDYRSLASKS
jgi:hypothetical protein